MKKILLILLTISSFAFAGEEEKTVVQKTEIREWSEDISVKLVSKSVYTGLTVYDKPTVQTDCYITSPWGIYADVWFSKSTEHLNRFDNTDWGNEVDYSIGYSNTYKGFGYDVGVTYADVSNLGNSNGDSLNFYQEVNHPFEFSWQESKLTPFVKSEYYVPFRGHNPNAGHVLTAGTKYKFKVYENLSLEQKLAFVHDDGHFGNQSGHLGLYDACLAYNVRNTTLKLGTTIWVPITDFDERVDARGAHSTNTAWYGSVTFHF